MQVSQRVLELGRLIKYHDNKYWIENDPEIADEEYDQLIEELKRIDPENPILQKLNGPTYGTKVQHSEAMLSLDKVYSIEDLLKWCSGLIRSPNERFSIQPKFDGWSGQYNDQILYTRGDSGFGQNISDKKILITLVLEKERTLPLVEYSEKARGEILMKKSTFKQYQPKIIRKDGKQYKTERSILAGILRTKDNTPFLQYPGILEFVSYEAFSTVLTYQEMLSFDWNEFIGFVKNSDYPTDGLVIKLVDQEYSSSLGVTAHHPRGQIALKYGNPTGEGVVLGVEWFVGKGNTINPVAVLSPIIIAGHTITKANLHNAQNIIDINLHIGDRVVIERCGEIIPDIVKVIPGDNRQQIILDSCPSCGASIYYNEPFLYCSNSECSGSLVKRLTDSCWRLGIENIGQSTIEKLINHGFENIFDILIIPLEEIKRLDRFGETSALNLFNEIQKVCENPVDEWKILSSLNIPGIGSTLSRSLLSQVSLSQLRQMKYEDLIKLPMIGPERAMDILHGLLDFSELLDDLLSLLKVKSTTTTRKSKGKVCFTGKMPQPRSYYEKLAEQNGFISVNSVTSDLAYLVCQDLSSTKGKMTKATSLGVKIITLSAFLELIHGG